MTAKEIQGMISNIDLNGFSDEEIRSICDSLLTKKTEGTCIIIQRNHSRTHHHPSNDKT